MPGSHTEYKSTLQVWQDFSAATLIESESYGNSALTEVRNASNLTLLMRSPVASRAGLLAGNVTETTLPNRFCMD